ncbi:MAG: DNA mismatch repair protein [Lachnospiraceae bacterium]|nr:DNA mismatch repair protein [Lachnospiraceae bacterium]
MGKLSLFYPIGTKHDFEKMSDETFHDLAGEVLVNALAHNEKERNLIRRDLVGMNGDPDVVSYRIEVFDDIIRFPKLRDELQQVLERVDFLRVYGSFNKLSEAEGVWELMHRMDEMREFIECVEAFYVCLQKYPIQSRGLKELFEYAKDLYEDSGFVELKKDIEGLKVTTSNLKSVTLGINLNSRFEVDTVGVVSINSKYFTNSEMLSNFKEFITRRDEIKDTAEWNGNYNFRPVKPDVDSAYRMLERTGQKYAGFSNPLLLGGFINMPDNDMAGGVMQYMTNITNSLLSRSIKHMRSVLTQHAAVDISDFSALVPELLFFVRMAEFIEKMREKGFAFCKPEVITDDPSPYMEAKCLYNLKLAQALYDTGGRMNDIVVNDLDFDADRLIYVLTGANRGGKTTLTQAIGVLYMLAQSGAYVPARKFRFTPVDMIFTHFPADEDKTLDLGRLGEECKRFREIFKKSTEKSIILLNETFSTTSYEEGYYIAVDAVKALRKKGPRTIYNTHMHKLGMELDMLNEGEGKGKVESLVSASKEGVRSYKVIVAPPEGLSYARDIAIKYGVTYEMLMSQEDDGLSE